MVLQRTTARCIASCSLESAPSDSCSPCQTCISGQSRTQPSFDRSSSTSLPRSTGFGLRLGHARSLTFSFFDEVRCPVVRRCNDGHLAIGDGLPLGVCLSEASLLIDAAWHVRKLYSDPTFGMRSPVVLVSPSPTMFWWVSCVTTAWGSSPPSSATFVCTAP